MRTNKYIQYVKAQGYNVLFSSWAQPIFYVNKHGVTISLSQNEILEYDSIRTTHQLTRSELNMNNLKSVIKKYEETN